MHLLVLDQELNCAHGTNNLVCLPAVFLFCWVLGQDSLVCCEGLTCHRGDSGSAG